MRRPKKWSVDELRAKQLERLQWSVGHAYDNVKHYRKACDDRGIHPDDIRVWRTRGCCHRPARPTCEPTARSGCSPCLVNGLWASTPPVALPAKPTVVDYTADDIAMWSCVVARSIRAAGIRPADVVHEAYGYGLFTGGLGAHSAPKRWAAP